MQRLHLEARAVYINRTVAFIGFMGVGKSSVGAIVAEELGRSVIDTDREVERLAGRSVQDLIEGGDEGLFRALEAEIIGELAVQKDLVLSLGGGATMSRATASLLHQNCMVVHLHVAWKEIHRSLPDLRATRPLLRGRTDQEIHSLYLARQATYRKAHIRIEVPRSSSREAADRVLQMLAPEPTQLLEDASVGASGRSSSR